MAASYQCSDCHTCWPYSPKYSTCPECRRPCMTCSVPRPLTIAEAIDRCRNLEFVRYCAQRDQKRERLGQPSPEELGRKEAEEIIQAAREIHALPET
jgi:hypothetical protein